MQTGILKERCPRCIGQNERLCFLEGEGVITGESKPDMQQTAPCRAARDGHTLLHTLVIVPVPLRVILPCDVQLSPVSLNMTIPGRGVPVTPPYAKKGQPECVLSFGEFCRAVPRVRERDPVRRIAGIPVTGRFVIGERMKSVLYQGLQSRCFRRYELLIDHCEGICPVLARSVFLCTPGGEGRLFDVRRWNAGGE